MQAGFLQGKLRALAAVDEDGVALVFYPAAGQPPVHQRHKAPCAGQTDIQHIKRLLFYFAGFCVEKKAPPEISPNGAVIILG